MIMNNFKYVFAFLKSNKKEVFSWQQKEEQVEVLQEEDQKDNHNFNLFLCNLIIFIYRLDY